MDWWRLQSVPPNVLTPVNAKPQTLKSRGMCGLTLCKNTKKYDFFFTGEQIATETVKQEN